jgi:hypothetical protein
MMISDGEIKGSTKGSEESHSFPLLNQDTMNVAAGASRCCQQSFKPLFNNGRREDPVSSRSGIGIPQSDAVQESAERVSQEGYRRGFDAGNQDACSMVREEMAPQINSVADVFNQWNANMLRLEENSNHHILQIAVSVTEKILGRVPEGNSGSLDTLKDVLRDHIRKAYRIVFKLNPEDMDVLSALMNCEHPEWGQWDYISVQGDAEVNRGSFRMQPATHTILDEAGIIHSLEGLLSKASTK